MIVCCTCAYSDVIPAGTRAAVHAGLSSRGDCVAVADLCALAAQRDPRLAAWARDPRLAVVACHPRAVRWLFDWAGAPLREGAVSFLDMRTHNAADILRALPPSRAKGKAKHDDLSARSPWVPWFPVLDRSRCVDCKQCASFCAFGVYSVVDAKVIVKNPAHCKNNCPACARMCPHAAIIFPKCAEDLIGGADVTPARLRTHRAAAKQPAHGADMHSLIAARSGRAAGTRG